MPIIATSTGNPQAVPINQQALTNLKAFIRLNAVSLGLTVYSDISQTFGKYYNFAVMLAELKSLKIKSRKGYLPQWGQKFRAAAAIVGIGFSSLSAPGSFVATPSGANQINLTWAAVTGATNYVVDRATNVGFTTGVALGIYSGALLLFNDTGRTAATQYFYRIRAQKTGYTDSGYSTANATTTA